MKKLFLLLVITLFVSVGAMAQTEHLKFMGIPLNGTITQFQNKLKAKGVDVNPSLNKFIPTGGRAFKGVFSGNDATIFVYYDEKTKKVMAKIKHVPDNTVDIKPKPVKSKK